MRKNSTAGLDSLFTVVRVVGADQPGGRPEEELLTWTSHTWRRMLFVLPMDADNFLGQLERSWDAVIDDLDRWCAGFQSRAEEDREQLEEVFGYLGLLLVTLLSLRHADAYRYRRGHAPVPAWSPQRADHDCERLCAGLLGHASVREAIRRIYAPDGWIPDVEPDGAGPDPLTTKEWDRIDFDTLRFHRHGTTSFILAGAPREPVQGQTKPLALKCIVYPYLRVPTIARATREYMSRYGVPGSEVDHLVRVWASGSSWILMDFVAGLTLGEILELRPGAGNGSAPTGRSEPGHQPGRLREVSVERLAELSRQLFAAMSDLERAGLRHSDLTPSNIIVRQRDDGGGPRFVLIDLGVNFLYTRAMPGWDGPDSVYVAPEIRGGDEGSRRSDLYSVGQLLIALAGSPNESDGTVPDSFYAETPALARFIEDLVDKEPSHRLLIFRPDPSRPLYPQLQAAFDEELAAVAASRDEPAWFSSPRWLGSLTDLFRPLAGAPARQRQLWRIRRTQQLYRDPRRSMNVRWLLFWSSLSAIAWYLGAVIVLTWWLRDLQWDWGNQLIALLQRATGKSEDEFPYLDALRANDYPIPDLRGNLPVRLVAMSFLLVGARYYQNLFAGLTPLVTGGGQGRLTVAAVVAEIHMRLQSVVALGLVLPPTLVQRRWWPIFTAVGILVCFLTNWTCLWFARSALQQARDRGLSTVPRRIAGLESFRDWVPSSGFYAAGCWVLGFFVYFGLAKDVYMYAGAVAAINVVLFYMIKCSGDSAAEVRTGLGRALLAAERMRYAAEVAPPRRALPDHPVSPGSSFLRAVRRPPRPARSRSRSRTR
jgi:serine/threonine protein kinase